MENECTLQNVRRNCKKEGRSRNERKEWKVGVSFAVHLDGKKSIPAPIAFCLILHFFSTSFSPPFRFLPLQYDYSTTCNLYSLWRNALALMIIFPNIAENCEAFIIAFISLFFFPTSPHDCVSVFCVYEEKIRKKEEYPLCDFIMARLFVSIVIVFSFQLFFSLFFFFFFLGNIM